MYEGTMTYESVEKLALNKRISKSLVSELSLLQVDYHLLEKLLE